MPQQNNMQQQAQQGMMQPPQVITTKDLNYLKDQLSWHLDAMKKCAHFAQEATIPQIKQALDQAGRMHQRHYQTLLQHCQENNTQAVNTFHQAQQQQQSNQQQPTM